jgi:tetratricopeptide (TPR) repeat protein
MEALLAHAAVCRNCTGSLRQSLRLHAEDASVEESAEIERLASASVVWQRRLAAELSRTRRSAVRKWASGPWLWAGAGLAAMLAITAGFTGWWLHTSAPERLLAQAYTQSRSFELRIPGASYAEVMPESHLRGGSTGYESSALIDARARIESRLQRSPQNPRWLQLEARSEVLEERFDPAIEILDRLLAAGPVTSSLLADDATAYFQRGSYSGSESDRSKALDSLRRADELAPGDPVVLFNEALAMEDRGQLMNAVETWNRYLRFERDPRWVAEGQRRKNALELKLNSLKSPQSRNPGL